MAQNKDSSSGSKKAPVASGRSSAGPGRKGTMDVSDVINFYKGKNVLITGVSGFLGKVLLWKLLESCQGVGQIYVLMRAKNNLSAESRLIQLLKGKPFSFKHNYADLLQKVVAIESDITVDGLGLSPTDLSLLQKQVNIVLHCAASVRFDAPLKDNLRDNVYGTRSIVSLCDSMEHLQALVHVSTAYSNCHTKEVGEQLLPLKREVDEASAIIESLPDEACNLVMKEILEGRPNTYTYTKAMAEHLVAKQEGKYPISIVRPSIVISAANEPCPGWVDNVNGIVGLGCLAAIGVLRTIDWNYYATSDMVPVDFVANCIICAAYQCNIHSPKKLIIYNMTSGNVNPISWGSFFQLLRDRAVERPPGKIVRPIIDPPKHNRANPVQFFLIKFLSELLFAYTVDLLLTLMGYKKIMVKITRKMHNGYKILKPFTTNEWNFKSDNVVGLSESLSPGDRDLFNFDIKNLNWQEQARATYDGARQLLLKEDSSEESIKHARSRQKIVTVIHYGIMAFITSALMLAGYSSARLVRIF